LQVRGLQWWLWSYLTNVYVALSGKFDIPYVSHFWTLAVEEHFYLVWPFVVGLLARRTALGVSIIASLVALALRVGFDVGLPGSLYGHVLTPCRLDALCIGAFFALLVRGPLGIAGVAAIAKRGVPFAALGVLVTSLIHVWRPHGPGDAIRGIFLAVFFGFGIVLASWQGGPRWLKRVLLARWLRFLGKYSYGLYVFHAIIAYGLGAHDTLPRFERLAGGHLPGVFLQAALATAASVAIAVASYELFEVRFLRLKDRFEAKPAKPSNAPLEMDSKAGG
jgi:peptidoglycan/LPS O-acetylase OafA/YrhL